MPNFAVPQPLSTIVIGDTWTVQFSITVAGNAVDPSALTVRVEPPGGGDFDVVYPTGPTLVRTATGVYVLAVPMTVLGRWKVRAKLSVLTTGGTVQRVAEWSAVCVASSLMAPN